jgi:hypothetical protein
MIAFYFISLTIFIAYNAIIFRRYGIPVSLSETYYLLPEKIRVPIFFGMTVSVSIPLIIFGCNITSNDNMAVVMFLCPSMFIFVGAAAAFKQDFVEKYHITFALICAALSLVWIAFTYTKGLVFVAVIAIIFYLTGINTKGVRRDYLGFLVKDRNSKTFWMEMICFVSIYVCLLLYYFNI